MQPNLKIFSVCLEFVAFSNTFGKNIVLPFLGMAIAEP